MSNHPGIYRLFFVRWLLPLVLLSIEPVHAQHEVYVADKNMVGVQILYAGDTNYYLKNKPTTGYWIVYRDSTKSKVVLSVNYLGNNRIEHKTWYSDGTPKEFLLNNDSLPYYQHDMQMWYPNGQKRLEAFTTRDSSIGRNWWENGQLAYEKKLWGGKPWDHPYGEMISWHPTGVMYRKDWFYPDSTVIRSYYESGKLNSTSIYQPDSTAPFGSRCYYMHSFHENGKESSSELHPNLGRQPIIYYYENGIKQAECDWMEGNIGPYKEWHENGKLKAEGNYSVGIKKFTSTKSVNYYPTKTGHWIYYNEAGWKEKEEWRELDGTMTIKEYDATGKVIKEGTDTFEIPAGVVFPEEYQH